MREIYKYQPPMETMKLEDAVFGYVKDTKIKGNHITNICTEWHDDGLSGTNIVNYGINTNLIDEDGDYTVIFDLLPDENKPEHNALKISLGRVGQPSLATSNWIEWTAGRKIVHLIVNGVSSKTGSENLHWWVDGQGQHAGKNFKVHNVVFLKGYHYNLIPYFSGDMGTGTPEGDKYKIEVKTHGKNLFNVNIIKSTDELYPLIKKQGKFIISSKRLVTFDLLGFKEGRHVNNVALNNTNNETFNVDGIIIDEVKIRIKNNIEKLKINNIQLEEGTQATSYEPPHVHNYTYLLPKPLMSGETLEYDKDYTQYVIKNSDGKTIALTGYYDITFPVYPTPTYIEVEGGEHVDPSIEFYYPQKPPSGVHHGASDYFITLTSGDILDTRDWGTWEMDSKKNIITLKDSVYNAPDKYIQMKHIAKSVIIKHEGGDN